MWQCGSLKMPKMTVLGKMFKLKFCQGNFSLCEKRCASILNWTAFWRLPGNGWWNNAISFSWSSLVLQELDWKSKVKRGVVVSWDRMSTDVSSTFCSNFSILKERGGSFLRFITWKVLINIFLNSIICLITECGLGL